MTVLGDTFCVLSYLFKFYNIVSKKSKGNESHPVWLFQGELNPAKIVLIALTQKACYTDDIYSECRPISKKALF